MTSPFAGPRDLLERLKVLNYKWSKFFQLWKNICRSRLLLNKKKNYARAARALHLSRALATAISVESDLLRACSGLTVLT